MTGWTALKSRAGLMAGQLAWGFADLARILKEKGFLPARQYVCVSSTGTGYSVTGESIRHRSDARTPDCLVVLDEDCLWGEARLPPMGATALGSAVLEVLWRESPLPPEQMIAAWRALPVEDGTWAVEWAISRRALQESLREKFSLRSDALTFLARDAKALAVQNQEASRSIKKQRKMDLLGYVLMAMVLISLCGLVAMPIVIKRQGAVQATQMLASLESPAAPLRQKLDSLRQQNKLATELRRNMDAAVPSAVVIEALSSVLPDDTWLERIDINENEIRVAGMAANANDLITYIVRSNLFSDVKATAPNVRDAALNKERFSFEMKWRGEPRQ